ncbi:MAG: YkgJ family cysteine cluster protein [Methanoregula sp.]|nr:YkgJ family cysteine cluster protein [Methanoregula sp.]
MITAHDVPIPYRIVALMQEQNRLFAYPLERLAIEIWATRFRCSGCGACCTRAVNRHIFLLDSDVNAVRKIDPDAYEPAPDPEFCDQNGMLYVSGYALRMKDDEARSCWFLENDRCRIYDNRFSGCRIYPHMLRRGSDAGGTVAWHQFARKDEHGHYDTARSLDECLILAREVKEYETAFLNQQISFLETIHEYFSVHSLRNDHVVYTNRMQQYQQDRPVKIKVFHAGELEECRIARTD